MTDPKLEQQALCRAAFEDYFDTDCHDPIVLPEWEQWQHAWQAALSQQRAVAEGWVLVPRELLETAVCPMKESGCDGTQYPVQPHGEGEQCQWCYERNASLSAQQPAAVDGDWRKKAAEWLESEAVEQEAANQKWPEHAACYKEWRDRPGILRHLAIQVLAAQPGGSDNG